MALAVDTAYAKINLTLEVLGRRADGMHELVSLVTFAELGDRLSLELPSAADAQRQVLRVMGPFAGEIVGENLVERAVRAVERAAGVEAPFTLLLEKLLPVASGIGGGSADAAAALRLLRAAGVGGAASIDWDDIARGLGADVPVCLASRPALMSGTGEHVLPVALPSLDIVLANAQQAVPADKTRQVFSALGAGPLTGPSRQRVGPSLTRNEILAMVQEIGNDLEQPSAQVLPGLAALKAALGSARHCEAALLSGAGPTVVGIFSYGESAAAAARTIAAAHPTWWVKATRTLAA